MEKRSLLLILAVMACLGSMAQDRVYMLGDWKELRADTLLQLNVSEYKLDYN